MSLDAHIFRTVEFSAWALSLDFYNPNTLEVCCVPSDHSCRISISDFLSSQGNLAVHCSQGQAGCAPKLACYKQGKVINIPANRIQNTFPNRYMSEGPSAALLNTEFLFNRRLVSRHLWNLNFSAVHVPVPLVFEVGSLQHEMSDLRSDEPKSDY